MKAPHIRAKVLGHAETMAEDIIAGEESILFFEYEAHVVYRMAGGMERPYCGALCVEPLAVFDGVLAWIGLILVDPISKRAVILYQIFHAASVVTMPVS